MIFTTTLTLALLCFAVGMGLHVSRWLTVDPAAPSRSVRGSGYRGLSAFKGTLRALVLRAPALAKAFVLDVLLQVRTLKQSPYRWVMHQCIWLGFMLLLVFHAMDSLVSERFLSDYIPTVNPYFAGRDILGLVVLAGVLMAVIRRLRARQPRLKSSGRGTIPPSSSV